MICKRIPFFTFLVLFLLDGAQGQSSAKYSTGEILQQLERLNTLGSVLYIAAHPDDENTQLISYLANGVNVKTGYLAATRGDGGQNLVGPEIRELLGVIRTQELLAARRIDGGEQMFSRANDFGYSKNPEETFNVWDREKVLADFVWAIRKFRPDILITRFNVDPGTTHGHHTASAILAREAFELSGDPSAFPEQLKYVQVWKPAKIFWNTSSWFYQRTGQSFNEENFVKVNVGAYNPYLGASYTEISAKSRSMHKSQGFGVTGTRGENYEYFEQWGGEETGDLFGGIDITWGRMPGSTQVAHLLNKARLDFNPDRPYEILPELLHARKELLAFRDQYWKKIKLNEIEKTILAVTGTFIEAKADNFLFTRGDSIKLEVEIINRSPADIKLSGVGYSLWDDQTIYNIELKENQRVEFSSAFQLPKKITYSHPYWLEEKGTEGMYTVNDQNLVGLPQNPDLITAMVSLKIDNQFLDYYLPVVYKQNDPVKGEIYRPVVMVPKVMVSLDNKALVFGDENAKEVPVRVTAGTSKVSGSVYLDLPDGWRSKPENVSFTLENQGDERVVTFSLTPPAKASEATIRAMAQVDGEKFDRGIITIDYDHIPTQTLCPISETKVVKLDLHRVGQRIGYIMGAGDEVPFSLEQVGYDVILLDKDQVTKNNLQQFDAVILGIRAFNTVLWLSFKNEILFDYVKEGGNLIVQYNTSHQLVTEDVAPYTLKLSRDRVAVEEAPIKIIAQTHPLLNTPNKIGAEDFEGWVQERGLYFPDKWSEEFIPVFSLNDPGESPKEGSTLVAKYGKGYYCYTGLSFFRELPAGVPGAYRLLANMISLGKTTQPK